MKVRTIIFVLFFICNNNISIGQNFSCSSLITIAGNNYDFDILSPYNENPYMPTYICWINDNDFVYTLYLKEISSNDGKIVIISQDSTKKSNPQISINRYAEGIKIVWQQHLNGNWQILHRNYQNDLLTTERIIVDSLKTDPQITMNTHRIAWIDEGKLLMKDFYPEISDAIIIDSLYCSSPDLVKDDYLNHSEILYEKGTDGSKQIFWATLNKYISEYWNISQLSQGKNNINPKFGLLDDMAYQTYSKNVWKIVFTNYLRMPIHKDTTNNVRYNYKNPVVFTYPIRTSSEEIGIPFFVAFDTDSGDSNSNNISIQTFGYNISDSIISISNISGNNYHPDVAYLTYDDTTYISILWIRENSNKKDIWMAKTKFIPLWSNIEENSNAISGFSLTQNYPNPFNPTTTIEYCIPRPCFVLIKVYNLLGEAIETPVQEFKSPGKYKIRFNGSQYPSGIYFYRLNTRETVITKSMFLLR
ncbi:MAG: T9SS type A sorting domain-containing protein [bacterium]|nr:T9SS type A sorting domain-containing protein [bacterium]